MYGIDVSATRLDDLDKYLLEKLRTSEKQLKILEIGCGSGGVTKQLALLGAEVTAVDIQDYSSEFDEVENVTFVCADILSTNLGNTQYDYCLFQRTLHYLPFTDAARLLKELSLQCNSILISVTGLESDIGQHYRSMNVPLEKRFSCLTNEGQILFLIGKPICLYTKTEFIALIESSGFTIETLRTSAFGNHKAVAVSNK